MNKKISISEAVSFIGAIVAAITICIILRAYLDLTNTHISFSSRNLWEYIQAHTTYIKITVFSGAGLTILGLMLMKSSFTDTKDHVGNTDTLDDIPTKEKYSN